MSGLQFLPLSNETLDDLVIAHQLAYETRPNLTHFLGRRFVGLSFSYFLESNDGLGIVAYDDGEPIGFCVGGCSVPFQALNRYRKISAIRALAFRPWLWLHKEVGLRLIAEVFQSSSEPEPVFRGMPFCFIYSIAVVPSAAGKGIGKKLLETFESIGQERELKRCIIPIGTDNLASLAMARGRGYSEIDGVYYQGNMFLEVDL